MHSSIITTALLALLPALTVGLPTVTPRQVSNEGVGNAQFNWAQDTSIVSQFLSTATSLTGQDLANAAAVALAAELDEVNHKAVLDAVYVTIGNLDPNILVANNTLITQGTFQYVVDNLKILVANGAFFTPDQVFTVVSNINADRCKLVLPAIDVYLADAAFVGGNQFPNAATRPNNCP